MGDEKKLLTVEVVDDESSLRNALCDKLTREGFATLEGTNGEEGLTVALREHPDLILLDLIMPKMDGIAMLKRLREDEWGKSAKVIILTNLNEVEKISEAVVHGSRTYLVKSDLKIEDVVAKVKRELEK